MQSAWGDGPAYAACFAEDGDLLNRFGELFRGRAAIEAQMLRFFSGPAGRARQSMRLMDSRFVCADVVIMHVQSHVDFPPDGPAPEADNRQTMVLTLENGDWKMAAFQNTTISAPPVRPH